jgi:ferric-dicitrate binding protein FerR (iron transport regulator)
MKTNWILLAKVFAGEANEEELREYEKYKQDYDMLRKNWEAVNQDKIRVDTDRAWSNLKSRLEKEELLEADGRSYPQSRPGFLNRPGIRNINLYRVAATLALVIALGVTAYLVIYPSSKSMQMRAGTKELQEFGVKLPDGSTVDLNAWSALNYRLEESGTRHIELEGEAFFDVKHDADQPFVIFTGDAVIEVTGTSFGVRNDPETKKIEVYVESGNVSFYRSRKQDRILNLKAGQSAVLEQNRLSQKADPNPNRLSWKTKKLSFRETRLGDVAGVLNRTYSRDIRFENVALEDCLFTGTFDQQPIDSVVRVIQVAFDLDLNRQGKDYVLSGEACN